MKKKLTFYAAKDVFDLQTEICEERNQLTAFMAQNGGFTTKGRPFMG